MAYQVGDRVVYGIHGVCLIVDVEEQRFAGAVDQDPLSASARAGG